MAGDDCRGDFEEWFAIRCAAPFGYGVGWTGARSGGARRCVVSHVFPWRKVEHGYEIYACECLRMKFGSPSEWLLPYVERLRAATEAEREVVRDVFGTFRRPSPALSWLSCRRPLCSE
ncbi:hypothetical protein DP42_4714 [Burkholderia pseudomallei]|nr:hypothetical protein DP42_4714 [Burkholderia pseudomallei]